MIRYVTSGIVALLLLCGVAGATANAAKRNFTLVSGAEVGSGGGAYFTAGNGHHGFFGRGGEIDGQPNPTLTMQQGSKVTITLLDLDQRGQPAQLAIPDLDLTTPVLNQNGQSATLTFMADRAGTFAYTGQTVFDGRAQHVHMLGQIVVLPQ